MLSKFIRILLLLLIISPLYISAQEDSAGIGRYYYTDGTLSSEGPLKDGKPDGYWKTYYESGKLKSEGNRKNFELDSLWKFYDEEGKLILEINYSKGKKQGLKKTYREGEIQAENFVSDVKQGLTNMYYPGGNIWKSIPFVNGAENGLAKEYDSLGTIITLLEYRRGFVVSREYVNRRDQEGKKQGLWKNFWDNGNIRSEGTYRHDRKNGYFKEYMNDGKLFKIFKFENDSLIPDAEEIAKIDERADYYSNGKVKIIAQYKNNLPDGIRREYSPEGRLERGSVYRRGILIGEGITDEAGLRQGSWKEFWDEGKLRSEGKYKDGKRSGGWKFYHPNGQLEEAGLFDGQGRPDGDWKWYHDNGQLRMEAGFSKGREDGAFVEYDEQGNIIVHGEYLDAEKQGKWLYQYGDFKEEGTYQDGLRDGMWKSWFANGKLSFEGKFVEDLPDGRHIYYWENGLKKDEGVYVMGKKEGEWMKYNDDGSLFLIILFRAGIERRYDGTRIVPDIDNE